MDSWKNSLIEHLEILSFFARWNSENPFKIRAFERAAEALEKVPEKEIQERTKKKSLTELEGIGKGIAQVITEFTTTKDSEERLRLQGGLPDGVLELRKLPGLGVKKIKSLYEGLGVKSLGELEYACRENRLLHLTGFGIKSQDKLLAEIEKFKQRQGKLLLSDALEEAQKLESKFDPKIPFARVGALGRKLEIVESLEYLVPKEKKLHPLQPTQKEKSSVDFHLQSGTLVTFHFTTPKSFALESVYRTSHEKHWKSLVERAKKLGMDLSESSLSLSGKDQGVKTEADLYAQLKLEFHSAETREWEVHGLQSQLVEIKDIQGSFHAHSIFSDGKNTIEEMAAGAVKLGWKYLGMSEHSQTAFYARGLETITLDAYFAEIKKVNSKYSDFRIFAGIESDILKDGELDYPAKTLDRFDFVIASIHQRYGEKNMTQRLLRAIQNPRTRMLGHMSGRLLLGREAYQYDLKEIVKAAIESQVAIELNSAPQRLDIDWRDLHQAAAQGLLISINSDAHSVEALKNIELGVWMARKAGVPKSQILNTWDFQRLLRFLDERKAA